LQDSAAFIQQFESAAHKESLETEVEVVEVVVDKVVQDPELQKRLQKLTQENQKLTEQVCTSML